MISVRKSSERGKSNLDWLSSYHTFSFSDYQDSKFMGFRSLRVINEDVIAPTKGFDTHPHQNMEILTYVIKGALAHKDTMHNQSQIGRGEFQLMTAGKGVEHSEFNPSPKEEVHLLQIWIRPNQKGLKPEYQQKSFQEHIQGLKLVVSPNGQEGSLKIHQNAKIYLGRCKEAEAFSFQASNRHVWIQVVGGNIAVDGTLLTPGDGAAVSNKKAITLQAENNSEFLLFDLD
jgi:redox-sensitive bicupin YhaK (pirin superfamily)